MWSLSLSPAEKRQKSIRVSSVTPNNNDNNIILYMNHTHTHTTEHELNIIVYEVDGAST